MAPANPAGPALPRWRAPRRWWALAGGLWLLHLLLVQASGAGLHVDEAQYWDWSRHLDWGYYSKPPGIALLIRLSTALGGDGVLGVRWLAMLCWIAAGLVLGRLGARMAGERCGRRAALLFLLSPAAGLLGLVATTDAPLMLCWALWMALTWEAVQAGAHGQRQRSRLLWVVAGWALGAGMLSKYTLAAAVPCTVLWLGWERRSRASRGWKLGANLRGLTLALGLAGLLCLPHLLWNHSWGWPTLHHTAEITVQAATPGRGGWWPLLVFAAGQLLMLGPLGWWMGWRLWREHRPGFTRPQRAGCEAGAATAHSLAHPASRADHLTRAGAERFALAMSLPLLALGLAQAWHARAGLNWAAPALLGICLWLALATRRIGLPGRSWRSMLLVALALASAVPLLGRLAPLDAGHRPPAWDIWARMRGWDEALAALRPALAQHPGLPVLTDRRDWLVHARHAWRDLPRPASEVQSWPAPPQRRAAHHYELVSALPQPDAAAAPPRLLWLGREPPQLSQAPWVYLYAAPVLVAQARHGRIQAGLWLLERRP